MDSQVYTGLALEELAPADRPYLVLNMVATTDGKATVDGRTREMSSDADRTLFHNLRTQVDAVLVGAATVRIERYGHMTKTDELRDLRVSEGRAPEPLAVVVTARLDLPADLPLLQDSRCHVVVCTSSDTELPDCPARVEYLRPDAPSGQRFQLRPLLERLRAEHDVRAVLCEGGPLLNAQLLREDLVDELFLSVSPMLVGGADAPTIVTGEALEEPARLSLVGALEHEGELFLRYRVQH